MSEAKIPTLHNGAAKDQIATTVLMPGDPLRASYIAENFLSAAVQVNAVRGMYGYTGFYQGKRVTIQGSGMGIPSMALYAYELFSFYEVENIIRVGSTGAMTAGLGLKSIVIPIGASTDSNFQRQFNLSGSFSPTASFPLLYRAYRNAQEMGIPVTVGNIITSDVFYFDEATNLFDWCKMGVIAVDMETAGLYTTAARCGKNALSLLTVSDNMVTAELVSVQERESSFDQMISLALSLVD